MLSGEWLEGIVCGNDCRLGGRGVISIESARGEGGNQGGIDSKITVRCNC